jgi:hypothetical protein
MTDTLYPIKGSCTILDSYPTDDALTPTGSMQHHQRNMNCCSNSLSIAAWFAFSIAVAVACDSGSRKQSAPRRENH